MNEKEKRDAGLLYDGSFDRALLEERDRAKDLCHQYNMLPPGKLASEGAEILGRLLGRMGRGCVITPPFYCDYGYNIEVGDYFYTNHMVIILDVVKVTFGNYVFVGPNCGFYGASHALDVEKRNQGLEVGLPITVNDNVWLGGNVVVLPGVEIGAGSIIGAGSVVNRDVPPGVLAAGNPCRVIRDLTAEDADRYRMYQG